MGLRSPIPSTYKELSSCLDLTNYYRRFVKDSAKIAIPLHGTKELKLMLCPSPILVLLNFEASAPRTVLGTDVSDTAVGGAFMKRQRGMGERNRLRE
ncbi:hypothetical protein TSMEX_006229 [Taenia solium]|eukprot:TsM_000253100 transcript=TsM_000253100 gene=TsM_000253100